MKARHPYHHVPFGRGSVKKQAWPAAGPTGHEAFDTRLFSGTMHCTLETKTELAIRKIWEPDLAPWIPGASLKGLIRTTAQMTGAGCADRFLFDPKRDRQTDLTGVEPCGPKSACLVCRVFGYAPEGEKEFGWAGKVRFHDSGTPAGWTRKNWAGWLPDGNARLHRKNYLHESFYYAPSKPGSPRREPLGWKAYEHSRTLSPTAEDFQPELTVKTGTKFAFRAEFENLTPEELWVFHFALTLTHRCDRHPQPIDLCHKLGFGKALGLGSCKIAVDSIEALNTRRYFGAAPAQFQFPPCALDRYLARAPVQAMKQLLGFANAADCVRFPDHGWFRANAGAPIGQWEDHLALHPPADFPPPKPKTWQLPRIEKPPEPEEKKKPVESVADFPAAIVVEITSVGRKRGKVEWKGALYTCDLIGSLIGKKNGDKVLVLVTPKSADPVNRKFSGRING